MKRSLFAISAFLLVAPLRADADYDPYRVPKETLVQRVHVIALTPVALPASVTDPGTPAAAIEALIAQQLEAKGYRVVPSAEWSKIWGEMAKQVGGVYDPITGIPDPKKRNAAFDFTMRELARRHGVDAMAWLSVDQRGVDARLHSAIGDYGYYAFDQKLRWDGETFGGIDQWLPQLVLEYFLNVDLFDADGVPLYSIGYAIEYMRIYMLRTFQDVPRAELLGKRLPGAVKGALDALAPAAKPAQ